MTTEIKLNTLSPSAGARKPAKRVGRGMGSGKGKTCGRGHKGQKSRSGGSVPAGFEGGQMPLHRRLPKFGFNSRKARVTEEVNLTTLHNLKADVITFDVLKELGCVNFSTKRAKIFASGEISRPITIKNLPVTKGAKAAIEAAGGKVE